MKIYLFRHGELINPKKVVYGRLPGFHLSFFGRWQIWANALKVKKTKIKNIYSSPLERTMESAVIISNVLNIPEDDINTDNRLIEIDCRDWQGKPYLQYLETVDRHTTAFLNSKEVESITDSGKRVISCLENIASKGKDAIVVSHGDPIMGALINISKDEKMYYDYIKKGSFIRIDINGSDWKLGKYNQV